MKKTKVLVTGASGFIGAGICDTLLLKKIIVYGQYRKNIKRIKPLKKIKNFYPVKVDLLNFQKTNKLINKIKPEVIFHTAALHSPSPIDSPFPFFSANVVGTLNLLEACRLNNVTNFIHSSSMSIYGKKVKLPVDELQPRNPYDFYSLTKKIAEDIVLFYSKNFNIKAVILRYVGVYGSKRSWGAVTNFIKNAFLNKPLVINNNFNWDIIYIKDVGKANYMAFKKINKLKLEIINIGSGQQTNIVNLARKILKYTKSNSKLIVNFSPKSLPYRFYFNINKAKKLLDLRPTSLDNGLKETVNLFKI